MRNKRPTEIAAPSRLQSLRYAPARAGPTSQQKLKNGAAIGRGKEWEARDAPQARPSRPIVAIVS